jgi:predicted RNase H-like HicB family nuclease
MKNVIKVDGNKVFELQLSVLVFQEDKYFVAYCPSLNLSSYGNSIKDAKEAFDEAMQEYIEYGQENNTLHEDLIKNGWKVFENTKMQPPSQVELNIPAGLLRTQFNENWRVDVC